VLQGLVAYHREKKLAELSEVREKIVSLMQKTKQAKQLELDLKETEAKLKDVQVKIEKARQNQAELLQSQAFSEKQKLEAELKDARAKTRLHEDEVHSIISVIDVPMRKLAWDNPTHKKLIELYFNDLTTAVSQDSSFKFGDVIAKLKGAIETGMIYAKDKRREQALSAINMLTRNYLQGWLAQHCKLKNDEAELQEKIKNSEANIHESKLKVEIQKLEHEQEILNEAQAAIIRGQKRMDLDEEVKEAGNSLSSLLGMQIKILK